MIENFSHARDEADFQMLYPGGKSKMEKWTYEGRGDLKRGGGIGGGIVNNPDGFKYYCGKFEFVFCLRLQRSS